MKEGKFQRIILVKMYMWHEQAMASIITLLKMTTFPKQAMDRLDVKKLETNLCLVIVGLSGRSLSGDYSFVHTKILYVQSYSRRIDCGH